MNRCNSFTKPIHDTAVAGRFKPLPFHWKVIREAGSKHNASQARPTPGLRWQFLLNLADMRADQRRVFRVSFDELQTNPILAPAAHPELHGGRDHGGIVQAIGALQAQTH